MAAVPRALLDECVPRRLLRSFTDLSLSHVVDEGGPASEMVGSCGSCCELGFMVLITVDRNLEYQQNVAAVGIGVIVLHARTNRTGRSCLARVRGSGHAFTARKTGRDPPYRRLKTASHGIDGRRGERLWRNANVDVQIGREEHRPGPRDQRASSPRESRLEAQPARIFQSLEPLGSPDYRESCQIGEPPRRPRPGARASVSAAPAGRRRRRDLPAARRPERSSRIPRLGSNRCPAAPLATRRIHGRGSRVRDDPRDPVHARRPRGTHRRGRLDALSGAVHGARVSRARRTPRRTPRLTCVARIPVVERRVVGFRQRRRRCVRPRAACGARVARADRAWIASSGSRASSPSEPCPRLPMSAFGRSGSTCSARRRRPARARPERSQHPDDPLRRVAAHRLSMPGGRARDPV